MLTNQYWWRAFVITVVITVISVAIELVIGMAFALVMHRTLVGRGLVRTTTPGSPRAYLPAGMGDHHGRALRRPGRPSRRQRRGAVYPAESYRPETDHGADDVKSDQDVVEHGRDDPPCRQVARRGADPGRLRRGGRSPVESRCQG